MSFHGLDEFEKVWIIDFEFRAPDGNRPVPYCLVGREMWSGQLIRLWGGELVVGQPPFDPIKPKTLFVTYYASAEVACFRALGWPMPRRVLDLHAEYRCLTSGLQTPCGHGLLGALAGFGLDIASGVEKDQMRELAMRGGPYTAAEQLALLDYCQSDVDALAKLLVAMLPKIDLPRALLRGRYMVAAAEMEWAGIPIDVGHLNKLRLRWGQIQDRLIEVIDADFNVYNGTTFKADRFIEYLSHGDIPWPRLGSGSLALDDATFKSMAVTYPQLWSLSELRRTLSKLRSENLAVGDDGRNRCLLSAFGSKIGRNQPSNSKFIFGQPAWMRGLIRTDLGTAIAYIDYSQQEFGIAGALSGDPKMMDAYRSGDPYLEFAKQAGAAPAAATKVSHPEVREQFKICALGVQYGMGEQSLARSLGQSDRDARVLLRLHREAYPKF